MIERRAMKRIPINELLPIANCALWPAYERADKQGIAADSAPKPTLRAGPETIFARPYPSIGCSVSASGHSRARQLRDLVSSPLWKRTVQG